MLNLYYVECNVFSNWWVLLFMLQSIWFWQPLQISCHLKQLTYIDWRLKYAADAWWCMSKMWVTWALYIYHISHAGLFTACTNLALQFDLSCSKNKTQQHTGSDYQVLNSDRFWSYNTYVFFKLVDQNFTMQNMILKQLFRNHTTPEQQKDP